MDPRLAWTLGILGVGGIVVGGVALATAPKPAAPSQGPALNPVTGCPAGGMQPLALLTYTAKLAQTGTTLKLNVGDLLNVTLLRSAGSWVITASDDSVLQPVGNPTSSPDAGPVGGTDDVVTFKAVARGSATVTGTGGGGSFKITVNVACPGA